MNRKVVLACIAMFVFSSMLAVDFSDLLLKTEQSSSSELVRKSHGKRGRRGPRGYQGPPGPGGIDPSYAATQIVNVNLAGNDSTGDGSDQKPFLTIMRAMSVITDASPNKRYLISVGPGTYNELVSLKANVFISGTAPFLTRIGLIDLNDPTWTGNADNQSGLKNVMVLGPAALDLVAVQSTHGQIHIFQSRLMGDVRFIGCNSANMLFLYNCELFQNFSHQGGVANWYSSTILGDLSIQDQTSRVNSDGGQGVDTRFYGFGGGLVVPKTHSGSIPNFSILNDIPSPQQHLVLVDLAGFGVGGNLVITGDGVASDTQVFATADSLPPKDRTLFTNPLIDAKSLFLSTCGNSVGYEPANPGIWASPAPERVQEALDRISELLFELNSNTPIP